jgi:hypothetical protein
MITVLDAVMGSGKTSHMIQHMNAHQEQRFIYITPSLSECHRIAGTQPTNKTNLAPLRDRNGDLVYQEPSKYNCVPLTFRHPENTEKTKLKDLEDLVNQGENIVSTHALLRHFTKETLERIYSNNYILVLDEAIDPVAEYTLSSVEKSDLLDQQLIKVAEDGYTLEWNYEISAFTRRPNEPYYKVQKLCDQGNLLLLFHTLADKRPNSKHVFIWEITEGIFSAFSEIIVLTYQFQGSLLKSYLEAKKVQYTVDTSTLDRGLKYGHLIEIMDDPKFNLHNGSDWKLSRSGSRGLTLDQIKKLKDNCYNLSQNVWKAKSKDILWTCFKDDKTSLSGNGYSKGFLEQTCRATNAYKDKSCLLYLVDRHPKVTVRRYLEDIGGKVEMDIWSLNELLQWMFRSCVREGKPIQIYIPSGRMRKLLNEWCQSH